MDNKKSKRREIDYSDWEYYVNLSGSSSSSSDSSGDVHLNSSNTENDHEVTLPVNPAAGAGAGNGVLSSPKATATSDVELENAKNEIHFHHSAFPTCNNISSPNPGFSRTSLHYRHRNFPAVSSTGDGVIEIDLTNEDENIQQMPRSPRQNQLPKPPPPPVISKRPRTQPASIIATNPQPAAPSSFVAAVESEKYPAVTTTTWNGHYYMTSTPAPSVPAYNPVYPGSESWNWNVHSMTNTGTNFTQYQNPPNLNYSCQSLWGGNMQWLGPVNFLPPTNSHLPPLNYYSNFQRSRYSVPGKPGTLITINTNADSSNNAQTQTPSASATSVSVPVVTPNPKSASVHANNVQKENQEKTADAATLAGVKAKDQQDRNQNHPGSVYTAVTTALLGSSEQSVAVPGAVPEAPVNTPTSDLIPSSTTSITEVTEPCTDVKKEQVKPEPLDFSSIVTSPFVKYGFHRLYDVSTNAKGNSEEFLCIVGGCTFISKTYEEIENHLNEKHLKSGGSTEKGVLFTPDPTEGAGKKKTKFTCNFLGCEKQVNTPTQKSQHVSCKHLDKRNYCPILHCHEKFFYEKQMYHHLGTFHRKEDNGGKKPKPGSGS